jgi:CRP-like cAMP-binding protein
MPKKAPPVSPPGFRGVHAILGMDVVSYSTFGEEDQLEAILHLTQWIRQALQYHDVGENDYIWSHAGDGGYLTFGSREACIKAIDVAFAIVRRVKSKEWQTRTGERVRLRMGLHAGLIQSAFGLGLERVQGVSGVGINMTARILSVTSADQLLISRQYFDTFITKHRNKDDFEIGSVHTRSVKHGVKVEVMNANVGDLCLPEAEAGALQWQAISNLWRQMQNDYEALVHDSLRAGSPLTAMAAAKYLFTFKSTELVRRLCRAIGAEHATHEFDFPIQRHELFGRMPADTLYGVIEMATPRLVDADAPIVKLGDPATTCFFIVSGRALIERPGGKDILEARSAELVGEFGLWISGLKRTATVVARDKVLVIEIPIPEFRAALEQAGCMDVVRELIKRRVRSNVVGVHELFGGVPLESSEFAFGCDKYPAGHELDISSTTYFLFNGRVELRPQPAAPFVVTATGQASADTVVGIVSRAGQPDGASARVLEETVAVSISHPLLRAAQDRHPQIQRCWDALWGLRVAGLPRTAAHAPGS